MAVGVAHASWPELDNRVPLAVASRPAVVFDRPAASIRGPFALGLLLLAPTLFAWTQSCLGESQAWSGTGPRAKSVEAIARDPLNPSRLWAATFGAGVYRSLDGGTTWTGYRDGLTNTYVRCLAVNPVHPDSIFCGTNDGVFLSVDGGVNWIQKLATLQSVRGLAIHPSRTAIVYAATYGLGVFKSLNGGSTWNAINLGLVNTKVRDITLHPTKPDTLFAATALGGGIHRSFNGGLSWSQVPDTTASVGAAEQIQIDRLDPNRIYAAMLDRGVVRSTDGGTNWLRINRGLTSFRCRSLALVDSLRYVGTDSAGVYFTTLNDTLWHQVNGGLTNGTIDGLLTVASSPSTAWAGTDGGGIFRTDNRGTSWTQLDGGLLKTFGFSLAVRPSSHTVYVGTGFGDQFWRSIDQGNTWTRAPKLFSRDSERAVVPDPLASQTVYLAAYGQGVYRSADDGASWFNPDSATHSLTNVYVRDLVAWPGQTGHLFVGTGAGVFESADGGGAWSADTTGLPPSSGVRSVALVAGTPATLYAGTDSFGVYRSSDGGQTWVPKNAGLASPFIHDLITDVTAPMTVYAATDSGVYKTTNAGDAWIPARSGLPAGEVRALAEDTVHPQALFCAVWGSGVFRSLDGGLSWQVLINQAGLPSLNVRSLAVDGGLLRLYVGTDAGVSTLSNYPLTPTAVGDLVTAPALQLAVRPSPTRRGQVQVYYSLSHPARVTVELFSVHGRCVRTLVNDEAQLAGPHTVKWDCRNQAGQPVATGVYFLRLDTKQGIRTVKFVILS